MQLVELTIENETIITAIIIIIVIIMDGCLINYSPPLVRAWTSSLPQRDTREITDK